MEHKLVEALAQLLRANNQSKLALLAGRMGTFEVELARQAVSWSDEIYAQVGIDRSTSIAAIQDVEPFIHADDRAAVRARREQAFETGETYEDEFRVVRADGEVRWLYVRAQPLPAENPTHAYGVSMDITERKERESAYPLSDVGGLAPLEEPAGGGPGHRLADGAFDQLADRIRRGFRRRG